MNVVRDKKLSTRAFDAVSHGHRLGGRRRFVEQRGIRNLHAGEVAHHGLEIEQRFEPALRQLGLIGSVGRIPTGILQDVAQDDRGHVAIVVTHSDEAAAQRVFAGKRTNLVERGMLVDGFGQGEGTAEADCLGDGFVDQLVERQAADGPEHARNFLRVGSDVPTGKRRKFCRGGAAHGEAISRFARDSRRGI